MVGVLNGSLVEKEYNSASISVLMDNLSLCVKWSIPGLVIEEGQDDAVAFVAVFALLGHNLPIASPPLLVPTFLALPFRRCCSRKPARAFNLRRASSREGGEDSRISAESIGGRGATRYDSRPATTVINTFLGAATRIAPGRSCAGTAHRERCRHTCLANKTFRLYGVEETHAATT